MVEQRDYILTLSCTDRIGIVATLANLMARHECFIASSRTFSDAVSGQFFARLVFRDEGTGTSLSAVRADLTEEARKLDAEWSISPEDEKTKVLLLVSQSDHCANTLLYGARRNELPIEVVGLVSNHNRLKENFAHWNLPWRHIPVTNETKDKAEAALFRVIEETGAELIVLARYMQVLSDSACRELEGRCINIHHSFLPSFKGGKPYHQAHARGVKVIGATAHYVTAELDEGPIISQAVEGVDHTSTPNDLIAIGRHLEGDALLRAVKAHSERRIFTHNQRTVVFAR